MPFDPREIEEAYQTAVIGKYPPQLVTCKGALILQHRPDLRETIDPEGVYLVTADEIRKLEP